MLELNVGVFVTSSKRTMVKNTVLSKTNNREPKDYLSEHSSKKVVIPHTFGTVVEGFVSSKKEGKDAIKTWHNYDRIFKQTIFPFFLQILHWIA